MEEVDKIIREDLEIGEEQLSVNDMSMLMSSMDDGSDACAIEDIVEFVEKGTQSSVGQQIQRYRIAAATRIQAIHRGYVARCAKRGREDPLKDVPDDELLDADNSPSNLWDADQYQAWHNSLL